MHSEYKRIVNNSEKAVLFIHGILGTPNHFKDFVDIVPQNFSVLNILLDGHGKTVKDFSKTSMKKWKNQVNEAVSMLSSTHNEIYIVAHSLGCLLAIDQVIKNPKIKKLFLLSVPLKVRIKPKLISNSLKVYLGVNEPHNPQLMAARERYGVGEDKNPFNYIGWVPRFLELFSEIRKQRNRITLLNTDITAYISLKDEMVSTRSKTYLELNKNINIVELKNSTHYYYDKEDYNRLLLDFKDLFLK